SFPAGHMISIGETLSRAFRTARKQLGFRQADVAASLDRNTGRIAELENDLKQGRSKRDRLQLFLEMADVLNLVPVLVPKHRVGEVHRLLNDQAPGELTKQRSVYEELHDIPEDI